MLPERPSLSWWDFVGAGDVVFDVGANIGSKAANFLSCGARVVCVEPQPDCVAVLEKKFQGNARVTIVPQGLAEKPGTLNLSICSEANTISTFAEDWKKGRFAEYKWDKVVPVAVTTLDELIQRHGAPRYCKIDVEGFELPVIMGLSRPVPLLSFEFTREFMEQAKACVKHLQSIGYEKFNFTVAETPALVGVGWLSPDALFAELEGRTDPVLWGDIYAQHGDEPKPKPPILEDADSLKNLQAIGLWQPGEPLRLHLGCGEQHFDGYLNIDYPPSQHQVMNIRADLCANILRLQFPPESVDEIRLHHVFEHFNRVTALALLIRWHTWLKVGGVLRLETPDLEGSARTIASRTASWKRKMAAVRHLAGDQVDSWAYHVDHWFPARFEHTLGELGFSSIKVRATSWPHEPRLCNVEVTAKKQARSPAQQLQAADALLWESTVADVEQPTFEAWARQLRALLERDLPPSSMYSPGPEFSQVARAAEFLTGKPSSGLGGKLKKLVGRGDNRPELPLEEIHNFNQNDRDKWVAAKAATVKAGELVLDVGAGTCPYRRLFAHCHYMAHDFKKYEGVKLGNVHDYGKIDVVSDIEHIPLADGSVDVVLCTEVLEHVPEPAQALKEMARLVKPGGRLFLTAPLGSGLHQLPFHYYGGYTPEWYKHFAAKFGLTVVEITPNGGFFKQLAQECSRVAWTFDQHRHLHGGHADKVRRLFGEWLPRYLFALEQKHLNDQFTVGYHVELAKPA